MGNIKGENRSEQFLIRIISYENNPGKRFIVQKRVNLHTKILETLESFLYLPSSS